MFAQCTLSKNCECDPGYSGDGRSCQPIPQRLTALSLTGGALSPAFSPNTFAYTATVTAASTIVTAMPIAGSMVSINGMPSPATIVVGAATLVQIVVTQGSISQTYTVTLSSPRLSSLTVQGGTLMPAFSANVFSYSAKVPAVSTTVSAVAATGYTATIDGMNSPRTYASLPTAPVTIVVANGAVSQSYLLSIVPDATYLKASNTGANDSFGDAIAISADGNTLVVGASSEDSSGRGVNVTVNDDASPNSGAVYVYRRTGTTWALSGFFKASNADPYDWFGTAVAISDDGRLIAVGASGEDSDSSNTPMSNTSLDSGAVYLFGFSNGSWSQTEFIKTGASLGSGFGWALAMGGGRLVVGAPGANTGVSGRTGAVVVLSLWGSMTAWDLGSTSDERFGAVVAASADGTTMAVGAPNYYSGGRVDSQDFSSPSYSSLISPLATGSGCSGCRYGWSLALSSDGNRLVVGSPGTASNTGAVYIYQVEVRTIRWRQVAALTPSLSAGARFGASVALTTQGNELFIGAPGDQAGGRVHVYRNPAGTWTLAGLIAPPVGDQGDGFGTSVACGRSPLWGTRSPCAVGAPDEDGASTGLSGDPSSNGALDSGAVWWFNF